MRTLMILAALGLALFPAEIQARVVRVKIYKRPCVDGSMCPPPAPPPPICSGEGPNCEWGPDCTGPTGEIGDCAPPEVDDAWIEAAIVFGCEPLVEEDGVLALECPDRPGDFTGVDAPSGWAWCSAGFDCHGTNVPGISQCHYRCCDTPAHWSMVATCATIVACHFTSTGGSVTCPVPFEG